MISYGIDFDDFGYADMHRILSSGMQAQEYAWKYCRQITSRETAYTLYGPDTRHLGVLAAGGLTPAKLRRVQTSVRSKKYLKYEFDNDQNLIRIIHMTDGNTVYCTYHIFQEDGCLFGCAFPWARNVFPHREVYVVKFENNRPKYFAVTMSNYLSIDLYQYPSPDRVLTTHYLYLPGSKYCSTGLKASWEAPMGAQNSPVTIDTKDEEYKHIDFSLFLRKRD